MLVALLLPRLLANRPDRPAMLGGAILMSASLAFGVALTGFGQVIEWPMLLLTWFATGIGYSMTLTPSGRLLKRSAASADRPAVFAAQFSLSHACWLIAYPLAGQVGARYGMRAAFVVLACVSVVGFLAAWRVWPAANHEDTVPVR